MTFESSPSYSANCQSCGFPIGPGAPGCARCAPGPTNVTDAKAAGYLAAHEMRLNRADRFATIVLDGLIWALTAGIGWLIWALFASRRRQTPAKIVRNHWVITPVNARPAPLVRYMTRTVMSFLELAYIVAGLIWGFSVIIGAGGNWVSTFLIPGLIIGFVAIDFLWLLTPSQTRLLDRILGTQVVHRPGWDFGHNSQHTRK